MAFSAIAAACPTTVAVSLTELSPKVLTHVASQQSDFPRLKAITVIPSGFFPSPLLRPTGSKTDGIPADFSARQMISFKAACRGSLPSLNLHESKWYPYSSTFFPHLHWWGTQSFEPVLRATAILSSSGLSCVPKLGTGTADTQAPDSGWDDASNRALENC